MRVQERHTQRLMASKDVVGTAVGQNDAGELVVKIYTVKEGVAAFRRDWTARKSMWKSPA